MIPERLPNPPKNAAQQQTALINAYEVSADRASSRVLYVNGCAG